MSPTVAKLIFNLVVISALLFFAVLLLNETTEPILYLYAQILEQLKDVK